MTSERWSAEQVAASAPDSSSLAAARKLATPGPWSRTGATSTLLWGQCQGSGATPYQVSIDLLAPAFARWQAQLDSFGFAPIRNAWLARAAKLGEPIIARTGRSESRGVFEGIDDSGALLLRTPAGRQAIPAADVYFGG